MKAHIRVARTSNNLTEMKRFYRDGLGFEIIGSFEDHDGFDGIMLGHPGWQYHLEFTHIHGHQVIDPPDEENLLIFYLPDRAQWQAAVDRMLQQGYHSTDSENPYWQVRGKTFMDPDGYLVVLQNAAWD